MSGAGEIEDKDTTDDDDEASPKVFSSNNVNASDMADLLG